MRIFATFFDDGRPSGFWLEGINDSHQPEGCTEITEAQWQELLQGDKMWDGSGVVNYAPPPPTLEEAKTAKVAAVAAAMEARLADGALSVGGKHIALDVETRTDLGAMATTAALAAGGSIPWPASYQTGWITMENTRIALPTPADGIALASAVGNIYAQIRQYARDLKDDALAATTEAELEAVDETAGWP
jgi:hypothetical protein